VASRTVSERAFEEYLSKHRLVARYEELPSDITRPCDYSLDLDGKTIRFEVKEWAPQPPTSGYFDPYPPIRQKIEEGRRKFKQYKERGEPCVLVLCHHGRQFIMLDPLGIFGAMCGDFGWVVPFETTTGVADTDRAEKAFLEGGSMIHHVPNGSVRLQNTTISAIAVLGSMDICARRLRIEYRRRKLAAERPMAPDERLAVLEELDQQTEVREPEVRVAVYDNPDRAVLLPAQFPSGLYDERFGWDGNRPLRSYVGAGLAAIEREEDDVGIERQDPLALRAQREVDA
jgi:hypothetical protein